MKNYNFDISDLEKPLEIIERYGHKLYDDTREYVIVKTSTYDGEILPTSATFSHIQNLFEPENIQKDLGTVEGNERKTYEIYLTSKVMKNLKWRMMFIRFGYGSYPLTAVVEKNVAGDIRKITEFANGDSYIFRLNSSSEFNLFCSIVFESSDTVHDFVQSVITESLEREAEKVDS